MQSIYLKPGREKSVRLGHPWIFSGGIGRVVGNPQPGETVAVRSDGGEFLAWAAYSPESQIRARVWGLKETETIDREFLKERIKKALALRTACIQAEGSDAVRLVHGESDGMPGLVVDRYGAVLVAQFLSAGAEYWKEDIADLLIELTGAECLYERSDADVRRLEGLQERSGLMRGSDTAGPVTIQENGLKFWVDFRSGQKTGFYIDQRQNRQRLGQMALGRDVLNCFCYTGGFSVYALAGGAKSVLSLDSSADALELAKQNMALNQLSDENAIWMEADVFHALRLFRDQGKSFDLIILDPPKFAPTAAQAERAARGYKDINLLAIKLLRPGGLLFTFSCSGGISADLFQKIVAGAAVDANAAVSVIEHLEQGIDHPVSLNFPEGAYLKGLVCWKA
jgi:23S rRNA (cytosine1962-C5)-methyltransferase